MKDTALIWIFIIHTVSSISCQTEKNEEFFEGDLILDPEKVSSSDVKNAFLSNPNRLWTGGVVFYLIDKDSILDAGVHRNIHEAIQDIEHSSCLVFKEFDKNNATGDYIKFRMHGDSKNSGNNCWSYMGRVGGPQVINIPSPNCTSVEIIKHEILHSTGAVHEHNRPDRDQFIKILHNNIKPDMAGNFVKREWEYFNEVHGVESFGTPYDVNSILHYPENAHGINGSKTILPRQPLNTSIGSMGDMTITDVIELNMVYGCEIHSSLLVEYIHYTAASSNLNKIVLSTMAEQAKINFNNTEKIKLEIEENIEEIDSKLETIDSKVEEEMSNLKEEMTSLKSSYKWEKKVSKDKIDIIVDGLMTKQSKLEEQVKNLDKIVKNKDNVIAALIEEIQDKRTNYTGTTVEKDVENLLKLNAKKNCFELATAGFTRSGFYFVDPDGEANKNPPIRAWCTFGETVEEAKTEVLHDSESRTQVAQCKEPKCFTKSITYEASKKQIEALKEISDTCTQQLRYDCFLAPLTQWGGVQFGTWRDQHGLEQSLCQNCNCNTYAPSNLSDIIKVEDMSLLPISSVSFGGVIAPPQHAYHTVGRLICASTGLSGGWSTWSSWSQCPACGASSAERRRSRSCTNPEPSKQGQPCQGDVEQVEECGIKPCPVDCLLTEWTEFSSCSVTCGGGEKRRTRKIKQREMHAGTSCQQKKVDIQSCNHHKCTIDCEFGPWGEFEACTATCGGGFMTRWRDISVEAQFGGKECHGGKNETWICNTAECPLPVDCEFGPWGEFEACTATCGGGSMTRWRDISVEAQFGGQECHGGRNETWICNTAECPLPVDCQWSPWEVVGECSTNVCGSEGTVQTTRTIQTQAQHGGAICEGGNTGPGTKSCSEECGVALIVGGASTRKKVELWSINNRCNKELPETVFDRYSTSTDYFDGQILTCGGSSDSFTNGHYMDFSTKTWKFHSTLRKQRRYQSSVSLGNKLYLIGSLDSDKGTIEYLEAGSTTWKDGPTPHDVYYGSCTVRTSPSTFVVIGGNNSKRKAREYNITSGSWRYLPDLLVDRCVFGCAMVDVRAPGKQHITGIIVAGGEASTSQQTAEFMNMATQSWVKTTDLNYSHNDGVMLDLGGRYFIFGGQTSKAVEEFDPWTLRWKAGYPDMKRARDRFPGITRIPAAKLEDCEA